MFMRLVLIFVLNGMLLAQEQTYYLTHIASTWKTLFFVDNLDSQDASFQLTLYDNDGGQLSQQTYTVKAMELFTLDFSAASPTATSGVATTSSNELVFRLSFIHPTENGTAEFSLPTMVSNTLYYNFGVYSADQVPLTYKAFALFNAGAEEETVQLKLYDSSGTELATSETVVKGHTRYANLIQSQFGELNGEFRHVARMVASCDCELGGLNISGNNGLQLLFGNAVGRNRPIVSTSWDASPDASAPNAADVNGTQFTSSTKLDIAWNQAPGMIDHYQVTLQDQTTGTSETYTSTEAQLTVSELKSETEYEITVSACVDAQCTTQLSGEGVASASTAREVWQVAGVGNGWSNATNLVPDANTKPWVLPYGDWSGDQEPRLQLYYDPNVQERKGISIAQAPLPNEDDVNAYTDFETLSGYGFIRGTINETETRPFTGTFQAIPLRNGKIRLFVEGTFGDNGYIMSFDSQDGYTGLDFNGDEATLCSSADDYAGPCAPVDQLGNDGDVNDLTRARVVRQFKVIYPTRDSWIWNEAVGTPMVVTIHYYTDYNCSDRAFNATYAVWDGTNWIFQYDENGCFRQWPGAQAPSPMHLGGDRYKMYYSNNVKGPTDMVFPDDPKPMRLVYGEGSRTGTSLLEFDDWDTVDAARQVDYIWPDGSQLDEETEENILDDYQHMIPTENSDFHLMYSNTGYGITALVLINP